MAATGPGAGISLIVGDWIEVRFHCQDEDQAGINVRHYRKYLEETGAGVFTLGQFVDMLNGVFTPLYRPCLNNTSVYVGADARIISGVFPSARAEAFPGPLAGLAPAGPLPGQVSSVVGLQTRLGGQRGRGRTYVPFPPVNAMDAMGKMTAVFRDGPLKNIARQLAAVQIFLDNTTHAHYFQPTLYRRHKDGPPEVLAAMTDVISATSPGKFGTQRRRGQYGAPNPIPSASVPA